MLTSRRHLMPSFDAAFFRRYAIFSLRLFLIRRFMISMLFSLIDADASLLLMALMLSFTPPD